MALRPGPPQPAGPLEDEDLLGEILVRLPPLPSSLVRAYAVSRHWGRLTADRAFHRRFRTHHRRPPVLGVFEMRGGELVFTPLLDGPDRIPRERFSMRFWHVLGTWTLLGYRHGRALVINPDLALLLVFAPVSRGLRVVLIPSDFVDGEYYVANGAVLCAAGDDEGHVHGDCHSGPFKVVLVATRRGHPVLARVYSSETGEWGDLRLMVEPCIVSNLFPSTLIGNALYWWLKMPQHAILKFDLDSETLSVLERPIFSDIPNTSIRIIRGEHGGVGLAVFSCRSLQMWERMLTSHGDAIWVPRRTARMHSMLQYATMLNIVGYSEDADAVLLTVSFGRVAPTYSFILQLESLEWRHLNQRFLGYSYHPFAYFYAAGTVRASRGAPAIGPSQQRSTIPAIEPPQQ